MTIPIIKKQVPGNGDSKIFISQSKIPVHLEEDWPSTESQIVAFIDLKYGSGRYIIALPGREHLRTIWRGVINELTDRKGNQVGIRYNTTKNSLKHNLGVKEQSDGRRAQQFKNVKKKVPGKLLNWEDNSSMSSERSEYQESELSDAYDIGGSVDNRGREGLPRED